MYVEEFENIWKLPDNVAFIKAICGARKDKLSLAAFLNNKIEESKESCSQICSNSSAVNSKQRSELNKVGLAAAALLLLRFEDRSNQKSLKDLALTILEYASITARKDLDFIGKAIDLIEYDFISPGFGWGILEVAQSLEVIALRLCNDSEFDLTQHHEVGYGLIRFSGGIARLYSPEAVDDPVKAFGIAGNRLQIYSDKDARLKDSDRQNPLRIGEFAADYVRSLSHKIVSKPKCRSLVEGEIVPIKISDDLEAEALGKYSNPKGLIAEEELLPGILTSDVIDFFYKGDIVKDAEVIEIEDSGPVFSIKKAYKRFALSRVKAAYRYHKVFEAKALKIIPKIGKINWMTSCGFAGITNYTEEDDIKIGDIETFTVSNYREISKGLFINLQPSSEAADTVWNDDDEILKDLCVTNPLSLKEDQKETVERSTLLSLSHIIASSADTQEPFENYLRLLSAEFLSKAIGQKNEENIYRASRRYWEACLVYAEKGVVTKIPQEALLSDEQSRILQLLSLANEPGKRLSELSNFVSFDETLSSNSQKIASRLLALGIAQFHKESAAEDADATRRKICEVLGVEPYFRSSAELEPGKYSSGEGHTTEFKSSYVMRNDGRGPDLDYQGRGQVFEAVCAFLNSDGGTLYLGVNDAGDPIDDPSLGLKGDMAYLCANYPDIFLSRKEKLGHGVPKADNLDHYVLFLNSEKELYFKQSVQSNITIEAAEDQDAILFRVKPSEYEIAYLYSDKTHSDGVAYIRDGARTLRMNAVEKNKRLSTLKRIDKSMEFIVTIQEAIDRHRRLIFRNYSSGNSAKLCDHYVVPIDLFYNDENVYCWDFTDNDYRQFRLSRIGNIDFDKDNPFYQKDFQPRQSDIFRWISDEKFHLKLRLGTKSKNILLEEYPLAASLPANELYPEGGSWILDTVVQGLVSVRRFYLGLADDIEILDTEDAAALKKYIQTSINTLCNTLN